MTDYRESDIIEILRRSYVAADGLWFVKVEQEHSYGEALRLDELVWQVMPKIQARKARELLDANEPTLEHLALSLGLKLAAEGHAFTVREQTEDSLRISVERCPWNAALEKSGRQSISSEICERICHPELCTWAAEFSDDIAFEFEAKMPDPAPFCLLRFSRTTST